MSQMCPITKNKVLYLDCLDCEERSICNSNPVKYTKNLDDLNSKPDISSSIPEDNNIQINGGK